MPNNMTTPLKKDVITVYADPRNSGDDGINPNQLVNEVQINHEDQDFN